MQAVTTEKVIKLCLNGIDNFNESDSSEQTPEGNWLSQCEKTVRNC